MSLQDLFNPQKVVLNYQNQEQNYTNSSNQYRFTVTDSQKNRLQELFKNLKNNE